jgi:hypothetical protein
MIISLVGKQSRSLLADFDTAGLEYELLVPRSGVIMNAGEAASIAQAIISAATVVIVAWLKYAPTRKIMITLPDNTVVHVEGRSLRKSSNCYEVLKESWLWMPQNNPGKMMASSAIRVENLEVATLADDPRLGIYASLTGMLPSLSCIGHSTLLPLA